MNKKQSQSGSAHFIVIFILVIALLGALGFVFWQNFIQTKTTENKTSSTSTSSTESSNEVVDNTKYFSIAQWDIKGVYDGQYKLEYQLKTNVDSLQYIQLSSPDVPKACQGRILKSITKFSANDIIGGQGHVAIDNPQTAEYNYKNNIIGKDLRKVGNSYYLLNQGVTDVCGDTEAEMSIEGQLLLDIDRFFLSLQLQ